GNSSGRTTMPAQRVGEAVEILQSRAYRLGKLRGDEIRVPVHQEIAQTGRSAEVLRQGRRNDPVLREQRKRIGGTFRHAERFMRTGVYGEVDAALNGLQGIEAYVVEQAFVALECRRVERQLGPQAARVMLDRLELAQQYVAINHPGRPGA